jgi:hypothetical protein
MIQWWQWYDVKWSHFNWMSVQPFYGIDWINDFIFVFVNWTNDFPAQKSSTFEIGFFQFYLRCCDKKSQYRQYQSIETSQSHYFQAPSRHVLFAVCLARKDLWEKYGLPLISTKWRKNQIFRPDISDVDSVLNPSTPLALRVSITLCVIVRYSRKVKASHLWLYRCASGSRWSTVICNNQSFSLPLGSASCFDLQSPFL